MTPIPSSFDETLIQTNRCIKDARELIGQLAKINTSIQQTIVSTRAQLNASYAYLRGERTCEKTE